MAGMPAITVMANRVMANNTVMAGAAIAVIDSQKGKN
jgi:hypothetical protein